MQSSNEVRNPHIPDIKTLQQNDSVKEVGTKIPSIHWTQGPALYLGGHLATDQSPHQCWLLTRRRLCSREPVPRRRSGHHYLSPDHHALCAMTTHTPRWAARCCNGKRYPILLLYIYEVRTTAVGDNDPVTQIAASIAFSVLKVLASNFTRPNDTRRFCSPHSPLRTRRTTN